MEKKTGFIAACKSFFGLKPGQSLAEFRDEMKELTPKDRMDIYQGFQEHDPIIECEMPSV
ncbi:MAG TPA: hypothetical protein VIY48_00600 [Candidatus Paceibacterota bacterium]